MPPRRRTYLTDDEVVTVREMILHHEFRKWFRTRAGIWMGWLVGGAPLMVLAWQVLQTFLHLLYPTGGGHF